MKMDQLRLTGAGTINLPLAGLDPSGPFVLKSVDGLDAPTVTVRLSRTTLEKAQYQGKSAALRQIISTITLQPDWDTGQTAEALRTQIYGLLTPKYGQMVRVEVLSQGTVQAYALGQVSNMSAPLFAKDSVVQLSIDCDFPYLLGPDIVTQSPAQSTIGGIRGFLVENIGTAPAGFQMGVILRANVGTTLTLSDENPLGEKIQIEGINWVSGDRFVVDTRPGSRGVWRGAGGGALVSVLPNLNAGISEWLQLYGGDNTLLLNTTAFDWDPTYLFRHQPTFWGV